MSIANARVIWSEGLFLRPHHFQQQERFFETLIESRLGPLHAFSYGFTRLVVDQPLLLQGKFAVAGAEGMLPDGTPFAVPSEAAQLAPLDIAEDVRDETVYLCAVLRRPGHKMVALEEGKRRTRFVGRDTTTADAVLGFDANAEVKVGVLSLALQLGSSLDGELTAMPVARIRERKGQVVELDDQFVPPLLDLRAHPRAQSWLDELHGLLKQRGDALQARIAAPGTKGVAEFADFMLLLMCNRYQPLLDQFRHTSPLHPLTAYYELLKLAGECSTFEANSRRPPTFEPYKHDALAETFLPVVDAVRRTMVMVIEQGVVQIPLTTLATGLYGADIPDVRLITSGYFVLAASAHVPREALRSTLPTQIKIGPPEKIRDLVMTAVPGIRIEPIDAPRQLPYHANFCYFQLDVQSEFWQGVKTSRRLAMYVAGELPGIDLQFWAIRT
ncbi:MAG: type VI secretion system baseplate subunit TssK [Burkholderiales bacterium]|nr:type VI secretion system baseplate subunit TssK [Burkholderiales bacterium]